MKCPFCNSQNLKVIDSRPSDDDTAIRRRRQCEECGRRFTTYEKVEIFPLMVVKKDETREPYDRAKIEAGIMRACHKRPIAMEKITDMINDIETCIFRQADREITSTEIGEIVMDHMRDLEDVAYVRFASVYRSFTDVDSFAEELKTLLKTKKKNSRAAKGDSE